MRSNRVHGFLCMSTLVAVCACASPGTETRERPVSDDGVQRCVASALDRNACARYASQRCANAFEVFEKDAVEDDGVERRSYHFRCL